MRDILTEKVAESQKVLMPCILCRHMTQGRGIDIPKSTLPNGKKRVAVYAICSDCSYNVTTEKGYEIKRILAQRYN